MKNRVKRLNAVLFGASVILCVVYRLVGGLWLKAITSSSFAVLGIVNVMYLLKRGCDRKAFPLWLVAGLVLSVAADVSLNVVFLVGAAVFALAHGCYVIAYCALQRLRLRDLPVMALGAAVSLLVVHSPLFQIADPFMKGFVSVYGLIIGCMLGKAAANYLRKKKRLQLLVLVGSAMFWFSDLMLAWELFAGGGYFADTLCLFTYFPGQAVLASSLFHYTETE